MKLYKKDTEYNATLKVSMLTYSEKPAKKQNETMRWREAVIPVSLLAQFIQDGHTFVPFARLKAECKDMMGNVVFLDFDHDKVGMDVMYDVVKLKPTIAYETYSNTTENNSYRFVYVFHDTFKGSQFEDVLNRIVEANGIETFDRRVVNQVYYGTSHEKRLIVSGCIYETPSDLTDTWEEIKVSEGKKQVKNSPFFSDDIWALYWKSSLTEFRNKCYEDVFCGLELPLETPYEKRDDERILEKPDNYQRVPIKQRWDKVLKQTVRVKWNDGERRHQKLYNTCMVVRRLVNPNADELLYYLVYYFLNYIDNSDGRFDKKYLVDVVVDAIKGDVSSLMKVGKASTFHVDPEYCRVNRLTKREVANKVNNEKRHDTKLKRMEKFKEVYNPSLSDSVNMLNLKKAGVNISLPTLKRWKSELKNIIPK